ncbi:hypothetical protein BCR44DRAFT_75773 [Catenaria anguillulae PL171]|uniref:Uncharacterized protein n=1 Tax=Catenaria anguillulae PL171 TaxID=765915 RepID=A0A1Y2H9G9_9FUNG|nr:hypothetical protein BCR44DRAFT_75773 [Catenaria anguillulae PL171]
MDSASHVAPTNHPDSSGIYAFKPLPLVKRMGRSYVPVDGDAPALILITAVAIGVLSISVGFMQQRVGGSGAGPTAEEAARIALVTCCGNQACRSLQSTLGDWTRRPLLAMFRRPMQLQLSWSLLAISFTSLDMSGSKRSKLSSGDGEEIVSWKKARVQ